MSLEEIKTLVHKGIDAMNKRDLTIHSRPFLSVHDFWEKKLI